MQTLLVEKEPSKQEVERLYRFYITEAAKLRSKILRKNVDLPLFCLTFTTFIFALAFQFRNGCSVRKSVCTGIGIGTWLMSFGLIIVMIVVSRGIYQRKKIYDQYIHSPGYRRFVLDERVEIYPSSEEVRVL